MSFADAIELRNHLANVLQPYLGEWEDGSPRIHIVPPRPKLDPRDKATATTSSEVECTIRRLAGGQVSAISGPQKFKMAQYRVDLVNYSDDTKLTQAVGAMEVDSKLTLDRPIAVIDATAQTFEQATAFVKVPQVLTEVVYIA